jgi:hypothetical protein
MLAHSLASAGCYASAFLACVQMQFIAAFSWHTVMYATLDGEGGSALCKGVMDGMMQSAKVVLEGNRSLGGFIGLASYVKGFC